MRREVNVTGSLIWSCTYCSEALREYYMRVVASKIEHSYSTTHGFVTASEGKYASFIRVIVANYRSMAEIL